MYSIFQKIFTVLIAVLCVQYLQAQEVKPVIRDFNYFYKTAEYDESKIPPYTLPDPLVCNDGERVTTKEEWENVRRPELMNIITTYMYGRTPQLQHALIWRVDTIDNKALEGKAIRKIITLQLTDKQGGPVLHLQLYVPRKTKVPIPLFLGLSFVSNNKISTAPEWQLQKLLNHGYGLATFLYTEVCPDKPDYRAWNEGLMPWYYRKGQTKPDPDQWGSIALWAWCASRAMDYLQADPLVDSQHVALIGHSRLGKVALWAGATDKRFKIVFLVNSGCCGAALSRRKIGETPTSINSVMPTWFDGNYKQFSDREEMMPFDQHSVIALIAPRPVYIASAEQDRWSDQKGEFLGGKGAEPVYALYGESGIGTDTMPPVDIPYNQGWIAYHIRKGPHAVLEYDWDQFIRYADRFFKK